MSAIAASEADAPAVSSRSSIARVMACTALFFAAQVLHDIGRDLARAAVVAASGHAALLHGTGVIAETPSGPSEYTMVCLSGSLFSTLVCLAAGAVYVRARSVGLRLFALYAIAFAGLGFAVDLLKIPYEGNFYDVAELLGLPMVYRIPLAVGGGVGLFVLMWEAGRRLQPPVVALVIPLAVDLIVRPIAFAPVPWGVVFMMWTGSVWWLVAIASAYWQKRGAHSAEGLASGEVRLWVPAWMLPVVLLLFVRLLVLGVPIGPW